MLRATLRFLARCALIGIAALAFLPLLSRLEPRLVALVPAAPQLAAAAAILGLGLLLLRSRRAAVAAVAVALWNLLQFGPAVFAGVPAAAAGGGPALKVIAFNLWYRNEDPAAVLDYLGRSGADVIGLVEATPRLKAALAPLQALYPHRVDCVDRDPSCEIMLLSKLPLTNAYAGRIEGRYPYVAEGEVVWNGRPVTIAMTHLSWPFLRAAAPERAATAIAPPEPELPGVPRLAQSLQAADLARHVNALPKDLVLMGDFNSASWSAMQQAFRAATGVENRGHLLPSWPAWLWPAFRLPIDQVFVRGAAQVAEIGTGPAVGSDHLPVEAEIAVGP